MGEQSEDDFELDYDPSGAPDVLERLQFVSGTKEDFASMVQASYESDHWVRKFRDYDCYRKMFGDEKIHYIVAKTKYSEFVGTCICFEMEKMCFVGIYYVIPKYRSKGVGKKLFSETVTDALKQQYNIGLHAVKAMSTIYEKELGFDKKANWLVDTVQISDINFEKLNDLKTSKTVKGVRDVEFEKLVQYDVSVNKTKRESYVRHWAFERNDSVCKVFLVALLLTDNKKHRFKYKR
ncbi:unnamed protein product [Anisakis simplex]|uniref:N-acetyltransferase domain-containing protein n=1 Tax=Anisakis simplex TaxID=6269 RepID=A0A0M3K741_ANISI|nr:unnamed protein product [Anisakis simplex]